MEIIGPILAGLAAMAVLAGIGLAAIVGLMVMGVLYFLTDFDFKKVFLVSAGVGLLAPILLAMGIGGAIADGSFERDLRDELGGVVQFPDDAGEQWREAFPKLREIGEAADRGEITEEEAEARVREILGGFEDLQIGIDVNGDGVQIGSDAENGDSGVTITIPDETTAEVPAREE